MTDSQVDRRSPLRSPWAVPIVVVVAVAASLAAQPLLAAGESNDLPDISAEELVARVLEADPQPMSGTVVHTARLGLPDLLFTEATGADPMSLLGGSSTLKVWTDGEQRSRVALLGAVSEYSVVADGADLWTYSSSDDEAVHYSVSDADRARLEAMSEEARAEVLARKAELPTPQEAAAEALAKADESSTISVDSQMIIAGRDVYQLVVTPDTDATLVERVVVAVDGETMTPLRVQTWSTQDQTAPAVEISFTDVSFQMPNESVFDFSPPAGATEREVVVPLPEQDGAMPSHEGTQHQKPTVTGSGWESVVELQGMDLTKLLAADPGAMSGMPDRLVGSDEAQELMDEFTPDHSGGMGLDTAALFEQLTTEVPEGRLISSTLLSILMTDDGRVLVGAVPAETLRAMA
ncbi:LolA family protein [Tessaracoccus sp. Y36]